MLRIYPRNKVIINWLLEKTTFVLLYPFRRHTGNGLSGIKNILLVEPFQMGDILSLTPLIDPLQKKFPGAKISFLTKPGSGAVMQYDSRIHKIYTSDFPWSDHGVKKFRLGRVLASFLFAFSLRKERFDLGIDSRGDIRSQILMVLAGCSLRLGYQNYLQSNLNLSGHLLNLSMPRPDYRHRYEWNSYLLTLLGIEKNELLPIRFPSFKPDKLSSAIAGSNFPIVIHVGGGWIYRRWSEAKWIQLINALEERESSNLLIIGGQGEKEILERIQSGVNVKDTVQFRITTFSEMIELINQSTLFIGLDSGPMNLATCLNKKVIALFGPGDASMWRPLSTDGKYIQKVNNFPCSPCLQLKCVFPEKNCMQEIEVEDVVKLL